MKTFSLQDQIFNKMIIIQILFKKNILWFKSKIGAIPKETSL